MRQTIRPCGLVVKTGDSSPDYFHVGWLPLDSNAWISRAASPCLLGDSLAEISPSTTSPGSCLHIAGPSLPTLQEQADDLGLRDRHCHLPTGPSAAAAGSSITESCGCACSLGVPAPVVSLAQGRDRSAFGPSNLPWADALIHEAPESTCSQPSRYHVLFPKMEHTGPCPAARPGGNSSDVPASAIEVGRADGLRQTCRRPRCIRGTQVSCRRPPRAQLRRMMYPRS